MRPGRESCVFVYFPRFGMLLSKGVWFSLCNNSSWCEVSLSLTIEDLHSFKRCLTAPTDAVTNWFVVS